MTKSRTQRIANSKAVVDRIVQAYAPGQTEIDSSLVRDLELYTKNRDRQIREQSLVYAADHLSQCPLLLDIVFEAAWRGSDGSSKERLISALATCDSPSVQEKLRSILIDENLSPSRGGPRDVAAPLRRIYSRCPACR